MSEENTAGPFMPTKMRPVFRTRAESIGDAEDLQRSNTADQAGVIKHFNTELRVLKCGSWILPEANISGMSAKR